MVTIITRTMPATDNLPTRIVARFGDAGWGPKRSTVSWDYALNAEHNHFIAARKLWAEWSGTLDATYVGAGDNHRSAERIHLLNAYHGEPSKFTGERGGCLNFIPTPDRS